VSEPIRVQLRRTKGWRMPENTVSVARPGKYGNPFKIGDFNVTNSTDAVHLFRRWMVDRMVVGPTPPNIDALRGKNLACWCPLSRPCHADVLLELANMPLPPPPSGDE